MPFTTEIITRNVIVHTCAKCNKRKEYDKLNYGEVVSCNGCQTTESFTGKQDIKYEIKGTHNSLFKRVFNNPWFVSLVVGLLLIVLVSFTIWFIWQNNKSNKASSSSETTIETPIKKGN